MGTVPIRPLVDRVLGGELDATLRRYVEEGLSPPRMSLRLASEHQVEVGAPTIRKWLAELSRREATSTCTARRAQTDHAAQSALLAQTAQPERTAQTTRSMTAGSPS
jgi:hypothetical protein